MQRDRGGRETKKVRERERENTSCDSCPKCFNDWGWSRLKPATKDSIWVFQVGGKCPGPQATFYYSSSTITMPSTASSSNVFPRHISRKLDQKEKPALKPVLIWTARAPGGPASSAEL